MKVIVEGCEKLANPKTYPWIGRYEGTDFRFVIVLFTSHKRGVVLSSNYRLSGSESDNWTEESFTMFNGKITLSN